MDEQRSDRLLHPLLELRGIIRLPPWENRRFKMPSCPTTEDVKEVVLQILRLVVKSLVYFDCWASELRSQREELTWPSAETGGWQLLTSFELLDCYFSSHLLSTCPLRQDGGSDLFTWTTRVFPKFEDPG